jgi:hypothetical protein
MAVSLIDVQARRSYPLQVEQREPPVSAEKPVEPPRKRQRGRPKGSQNHVKPIPTLTPDLTLLQVMITAIGARIAPLTVKHIVLDGHFGNYPATYAVRETGLHLISFAMMRPCICLMQGLNRAVSQPHVTVKNSTTTNYHPTHSFTR